jgi:hypothetical protein
MGNSGFASYPKQMPYKVDKSTKFEEEGDDEDAADGSYCPTAVIRAS